MSSKQSRIRRYPSYGDTSLLPPSADSPNGWRKKRYVLPFSAISEAVERKPVPSRPSILTLSSPVKESVDATDSEPIGNFLENCYYCKKKIAENGEIFMYSYLRAFCTAECRYSQIAKDIEMKRTSGELKDLALQNEEY